MPDPFLVSATVPLPSWTTPEKVGEVLSPPDINVMAPVMVLVTVPAPAREPIV